MSAARDATSTITKISRASESSASQLVTTKASGLATYLALTEEMDCFEQAIVNSNPLSLIGRIYFDQFVRANSLQC